MLLQMALFHSFLWLSSIPLCVYMCVCMCVCVCVCVCVYTHTHTHTHIHTYHIFFIHLSVNGHFGCFHALAIVNRQHFPPILFIYLLLAALGLRCCTRAFSSCFKQGLLFIALRGFPTEVSSLVAEHGL